MSSGLEVELEFALHLADLADTLTMAGFRSRMDVATKPDGTPVTEVDRAVEEALRAEVAARFPGHRVVGEEDGDSGGEDGPVWIIDPIDGTRSFISGNPVFATLIALSDPDGERVSVISAPAMGARWDAIRGGDARRDGVPIRVSDVTSIAQSQISFGDLQSFEEIGRADLLEQLIQATVRQRSYGDFHGFCQVAEGVMDICVEAIASRWDFAAPKLLVESAGGTFTALDGRATADGGSGVATNGALHGQVLALTAAPR